MNTTKTQLELQFDHSVRLASAPLPSRWWFQQMRVMVDRAFDWSTAPASPPEQFSLTLAKAR